VKKPYISVIIPLYNQSKYVGEGIRSALEQTYKDYEIIVIDDGSTDNSREVVELFGDQVRYIWQENKGLAGARNTGIRASKGELIGLLDADDQWLPKYLEKMVALADQYAEAAVYYCCAQSMDESGRDLPEIFGGPPRLPGEMYSTLLRANFLIPSTILMRRSAVEEAEMFDKSLRSCEDWDLWLRILKTDDIIGTSECLVRYRLHSSSLSTNPDGMQQATREVMEKHFGKDDGNPQKWSTEKRRAFGGVYRYHVLTSAHLRNDWGVAGSYFRKALQIDPTLSTDLDLFYDLAHVNQPPGFRGSKYGIDLEGNIGKIFAMLLDVFSVSDPSNLSSLRNKTYGTANYALGLIAYNLGSLYLSRNLYLKSLYYRPYLWRDKRLIGNLIKSYFNVSSG